MLKLDFGKVLQMVLKIWRVPQVVLYCMNLVLQVDILRSSLER